jgi:hypothetical protein
MAGPALRGAASSRQTDCACGSARGSIIGSILGAIVLVILTLMVFKPIL